MVNKIIKLEARRQKLLHELHELAWELETKLQRQSNKARTISQKAKQAIKPKRQSRESTSTALVQELTELGNEQRQTLIMTGKAMVKAKKAQKTHHKVIQLLQIAKQH